MRLKKLIMQAFGPFKDKVVIDFEKDKIDKGLLLITGDTGAGKTTIFDAICYALYGNTSGDTREANSLRSDWASNDMDTYVDLEFYYKNKLYEIKRSPEYTRKKKNGIGETKQVATSEANINGKIITKLTDVNKEIESLIGLDYKQFRQVAMLSQGEFSKFLLAPSLEKTTIFRKIFNTEFYDLLQNKLKSNMLSKKDEIEKIKDKIETERKNLELIINIYGLSNDETINILTKEIQNKSDEVILAKKERDKVNDEKTKLSTEISNINKMNKNILIYEDINHKLDELIKNNPDINKEKEKYNYNINIATYITNILDKLTSSNKLLSDKKEKYNQNKKDLELKQKEYNEKEDYFRKIENYVEYADKLNAEINCLINKNKDYDNYIIKASELELVKKEYKSLVNEYQKQESLYENMRMKYYLNISVEIAETLKDGEECPVCGSKKHPRLATEVECNYTKEDIEECEKNLKKIDNSRKLKEASIEQINKIIKEFNFKENINIVEEKNKNNELLNQKKKEKEKLDIEFREISSIKQKLSSMIKSLESSINIFKDDIESLEKDIKEYNVKLDNLYSENNTNYEDYQNNKLDKYELNSLKSKIDNYDSCKKEYESTIKLLEPEVNGKKVIDVKEKESQLNELIELYSKYDNLYTSLNTTLEKLKLSTSNIKDYLKDNKEVQDEYNVIKLLSDTANGTLTGKQRITFENYVQSYFMQSVLVEANKRLIKMTDSRYELKRKETETKLNVKTGLDFSIFDSYTGKERDVASLSGGEKFKASLALALGLSDTISNTHGGIRIDSLFIDEGFGSLDTESLNQALNILTDLSSNDKLIGVISHVTELISRIDNKIIVSKTSTGSKLSIEL